MLSAQASSCLSWRIAAALRGKRGGDDRLEYGHVGNGHNVDARRLHCDCRLSMAAYVPGVHSISQVIRYSSHAH